MKSFQKDKQEEDKLEPVKVQIAYYSLSKNKNKYVSWARRDLRGHVKERNKEGTVQAKPEDADKSPYMDPSSLLTLNSPPKHNVPMSRDDICVYTSTIQMICFSPGGLYRVNRSWNNPTQNQYFSEQ